MRRSKNIHLHFNGYVFKTYTQREGKKAKAKHIVENKTNNDCFKRQKKHSHTHIEMRRRTKESTNGMLKTDSSYCNQNSTCI